MAQQLTQTLILNQQISAPLISPAVTLSGSLLNATVKVVLTIPLNTTISFRAEVSADGVTWQSLAGFGLGVGSVPPKAQPSVDFTLPGTQGDQVRINVTAISGPLTVNSLTVSN